MTADRGVAAESPDIPHEEDAMRIGKVVVLGALMGAVVGAVVVWLWGREMEEYEDVGEALRSGQGAIRPGPAANKA